MSKPRFKIGDQVKCSRYPAESFEVIGLKMNISANFEWAYNLTFPGMWVQESELTLVPVRRALPISITW